MALCPNMDLRMARAGDILYAARKLRGFSQSELARVSGVGQPKISGYESHKVSLSYETLERLVGHCGLRLSVRLEDNYLPSVPEGHGERRMHEVQWAFEREPSRFEFLSVSAVPPASAHDKMTLLVHFVRGTPVQGAARAARLEAYLNRAAARLEVVDVAALRGERKDQLLGAAVPIAFRGRSAPPRETRFMPAPFDGRWYGTRLEGAPESPEHSYWVRSSARRYDEAWRSRYRRAVAAVKRAKAEEERSRDRRAGVWRRLDSSGLRWWREPP